MEIRIKDLQVGDVMRTPQDVPFTVSAIEGKANGWRTVSFEGGLELPYHVNEKVEVQRG